MPLGINRKKHTIKATLNIGSAAILRNNIIKPIENTATTGGAVDARNESTINMTDGIIENNQATYGGGIYLYKTRSDFSKIKFNR